MGGLFSWDTAKRVGAGIATGGLSEVYNYVKPKPVDTSSLGGAGANADATAQGLEEERRRRMVNAVRPPDAPTAPRPTSHGQPLPGGNVVGGPGDSFAGAAPLVDPTKIDTTYVDPLRQKQLDAIKLLEDAAAGNTPSAAEIMAKNAADRLAAQQFGQAAALQGGLSAGGALRMAQMGSAGVLGDANANAAALRAKEQADARASLVQGLGSIRGQEQDLSKAQSDVDLQTKISNQRSKLTAMGYDAAAINALLQAELQAMGFSVELSKAIVESNQRNAAAENSFDASLINAVVQGGGLLAKSDKRDKTNIRRADLGKLADSLKGFRFRYKDAADGEGERVGIMAQDALKGGPIGRSLVKLDGAKRLNLDVANSVGAALAMSAEALRASRGKVT